MKTCSCKNPWLTRDNINSLIKIGKVFSSKTKLKILFILLNRKHCVCEIQDCLAREQSLISHHLSDLVETGWIKKKQGKDARQVFYSLTKEGRNRLKIFIKIGDF